MNEASVQSNKAADSFLFEHVLFLKAAANTDWLLQLKVRDDN